MSSGRRRSGIGYRWAGLGAVLAAGVLLGAWQAPPAAMPSSEVPSPGPRPMGLAWDGTNLWVVDGETRLLQRVNPTTGETVRTFEIEIGQPGDVTWDGKNLWVLDEAEGMILRLDPRTGKRTGAIAAPKRTVEGPWSITGLAWDGKFLWVAISAGWGSSLNRIDPESGEVVMSFFPQCDPRGLASDGKHLWTIAYNGEKQPPKLDRRLLADEVGKMAQSQELLFDLKVKDPTSLTYAEGRLWVADRAEKRIVRIAAQPEAPAEK